MFQILGITSVIGFLIFSIFGIDPHNKVKNN
jgi:hypothetical protein